MKFYMYSQPIKSLRGGKVTGLLFRVEKEKVDEFECFRRIGLNRSEEHYQRLCRMLSESGDAGDGWFVLDGNRTEKDLINYMNTWR